MYYEKNRSKVLIFLKKIIYKIFGKNTLYIKKLFNLLKSINKKIFLFYCHIKFINKKDKLYIENLNLFEELEFDLKKIKKLTDHNKIDFYGKKVSWHYHIFANFSSNLNLKILEIGTYKGQTSNYLSSIFPYSKIYTLDLPDIKFKPDNKSDIFYVPQGAQLMSNDKVSNNINIKFEAKKFIDIRSKNLNKSNISFIQIDSSKTMELFTKQSFDFVWVDGNHVFPQVIYDIIQAYHLCKIGGYIVCDDIIKANIQDATKSSFGYYALNDLSSKKYLKTNFFNKTISIDNMNYKNQHFISLSKKIG